MYDKRLTSGKKAELYVFGKLLNLGVIPYIPMLDIAGVDAVIERDAGEFLELQIKSVSTLKNPRWFQIQRLEARKNYFIVCVNLTKDPPESWIFPSDVFQANATIARKIFDLDLDTTPGGADTKRGELLNQYKEAWHLLVPAIYDRGQA